MANVQIPVGFRRKTGVHAAFVLAGLIVLVDDLSNEILALFRGVVFGAHEYPHCIE